MTIKKYRFTLTGITPLLMHADSIEWADQMDAWKNRPDNNKKSKAGDDRSPAFRWIGALYLDGENVAMQSDCISRALMSAAARVPIPGGKNGKTFKQDTMAGMAIDDPYCELFVNGKQVPQSMVETLKLEPEFSNHQSAAAKHGFSLFLKRAKIGTSKHIRVRPKFDNWAVQGTVSVWDERLDKALPEIFDIAGAQMGLCDWRPSAPTPGPFGRFTVKVETMK